MFEIVQLLINLLFLFYIIRLEARVEKLEDERK